MTPHASSSSSALDPIRSVSSTALTLGLWVHLPLVIGVGLLVSGAPLLGPLVAVLLAAAIATVSWKLDPISPGTRATIGVAWAAMPAILVWQMAGHPWQIDMHMYFFAVLGILAALVCWTTLLVSAGAIAVHHLALNFVIPAMVFPDGGDFARVVVHAVIVVVQTGALVYITRQVAIGFRQSARAEMERERHAAEALAASDRQRAAESQAEGHRREALAELSGTLEEHTLQKLNALVLAGREMESASGAVSTDAAQVAQQIADALSSVGEAGRMAGTAAAATTQLSSSIEEIGRRAEEAAGVTRRAVDEAEEGDKTVATLAEAAGKIGDVVKLIQSIAEQTNLLALNATIEAARAGDAGKGFAVVASEVKTLANQTAQATEQIGSLIGSVQGVAGDTALALQRIGQVVSEIDQIAGSIAAAVEQQAAATREISTAIERTNQGVEHAGSLIGEATNIAERSGSAATEMSRTVAGITADTDGIRDELGGFLQKLRA